MWFRIQTLNQSCTCFPLTALMFPLSYLAPWLQLSMSSELSWKMVSSILYIIFLIFFYFDSFIAIRWDCSFCQARCLILTAQENLLLWPNICKSFHLMVYTKRWKMCCHSMPSILNWWPSWSKSFYIFVPNIPYMCVLWDKCASIYIFASMYVCFNTYIQSAWFVTQAILVSFSIPAIL